MRACAGGIVPGGAVILCGGAIGSPHLLMRSGLGPADELQTLGIRPVADLPAVVERLNGVFDTAQATLATYGGGSPISREAQAALRDVQSAAGAVASLARAIERRPNSLLLGR